MSETRYEYALRRLYTVLKAIDNSSSISDIAEKLGWRRASLYALLRALQSMGMVKVTAVPGLPRKVVPILTEKGKTFLECLEKVLS